MSAITPVDPKTFATIPQGPIMVRFEDEDHHIHLGNATSSSVSWEEEKQTFYATTGGTRSKAFEITTDLSGTFECEINVLSDAVRAIAARSGIAFQTQAAATDQTFTASNPVAGGAYKLPHEKVSGVTVTDGSATPIAYVEGTHYKVVGDAGIVQIIAVPVGADTEVNITYDVAAITATDKKALLRFASNLNVRGSILIVGTNDYGVKSLVELYSVQLTGSGRQYVVDGSDFATVSVTGSIFADLSRAPGDQYGYEKTL